MRKQTLGKKKLQTEEVGPQELDPSIMFLQPPEKEQPTFRSIGLIGDVDEEKATDVIYSLYVLKETGKSVVPPATKRGKEKTVYAPIDVIISTNGGSANEMFGIYDVMRDVRKECDISTFGVGKVMSAGVLLLAAGTKGKRRIGKHCRVMIHSVIAGNSGPVHNLENEMAEVRETQRRYIEALKSETKLTDKQIKAFFDRHVDIYLSAQDAVKYGIADVIV
jgi:ATP-dependent Clp endopeptidase proteolytic subunit ClpP